MSLFVAACSVNLLYAQRAPESLIRAISIQTHPTKSGTTVTLFADTPLIRTQTWKDIEGFHIVLPSAGRSRTGNIPRGVKVSRVGSSLEVLIRIQPGSDVRVQSLFNRLTLFISGQLNVSRKETFAQSPLLEPCQLGPRGLNFKLQLRCDELLSFELRATAPVATTPASQPETAAATTAAPSSPVVAVTDAPPAFEAANPTGQGEALAKYFPTTNLGLAVGEAAKSDATASAQASTQGPTYPTNAPTTAYDDESDLPQSKIEIEAEEGGGVFSSFLVPAGAVAFFGPGVLLFFLLRQHDPRKGSGAITETASIAADEGGQKVAREARGRGRRQLENSTSGNPVQTLETDAFELTLDAPHCTQGASGLAASGLFSEVTIRQAVSNLVKGLPYRSEALSSRALNDRQVLEAALVEALNTPELNEDERRRARQALEDHGFVLRRGAQLLSSPDARARAAAARSLAEMNSSASMPFLLEALYDAEAMVRMQVMSSLGAMKVPSAIGAVLEAAVRYPDTPPSLLSNVLNACSFGQVNDFETWGDSAFASQSGSRNSTEQLNQGIVPAAESKELNAFPPLEDLPESLDDENFAGTLNRLKDADEQVRASAARALGQFRAWHSVRALISTAEDDASAVVRATAVTSLGSINHESALAHLLIAFSDDARDVRAAAARSLSRLSIGRAAAFMRMLETANETMLHRVARACIKTGMVSQAIDKLTCPDRRQGYEAFLLLSILEKANETKAIADAAARCQNSEPRLAALRLFSLPELPKLPPESTTKLPPESTTKLPPESSPKVRAGSSDPSQERGIMPLYMPKPVQS